MPRASRTCTLLVTVPCAGVMVDAPPAGATSAAPAVRSHATVTTLSKTVAYASLVTTDRGVSLAMWIPGSPTVKPTTRLEWAVQRPGQAWSTPRTLASWRVSPYRQHGLPQLATASGHRVTAAWLDRRRRVVVENWSPKSGWSKPTHLSGLGSHARAVSIASNEAGMVAVSWSQVSWSDPGTFHTLSAPDAEENECEGLNAKIAVCHAGKLAVLPVTGKGSNVLKQVNAGEFDAFRTAAVFLEGGTLTTSPPERLGALLPAGKVRYSTRKFGVFTLRVALDRIVVANKGETKLLSLNGVQNRVLAK